MFLLHVLFVCLFVCLFVWLLVCLAFGLFDGPIHNSHGAPTRPIKYNLLRKIEFR